MNYYNYYMCTAHAIEMRYYYSTYNRCEYYTPVNTSNRRDCYTVVMTKIYDSRSYGISEIIGTTILPFCPLSSEIVTKINVFK